MIRTDAGMSTARFCALIDTPERTWRRWQANARADRPPKGPWPRPQRDAVREVVCRHALAHPAWGHRKIWAMTRHDGHQVSESTVLRLLRDEGLLLPAAYQQERRRLAQRRKAAFAAEPDGPNQMWQLDFSEFETTSGGTWRLAPQRAAQPDPHTTLTRPAATARGRRVLAGEAPALHCAWRLRSGCAAAPPLRCGLPTGPPVTPALGGSVPSPDHPQKPPTRSDRRDCQPGRSQRPVGLSPPVPTLGSCP